LVTIRVIDTDIEHPYFVTAADEAIAWAREKDLVDDTLHFYRRDPPGISLGYFKKVEEDVNIPQCQDSGVILVRRTSGGGTIFTDKNQLIYGLVTGKKFGNSIEDSFKNVCSVLVKALRSFDCAVEYKPPNDIILNGKKVSGNAQTIRNKVVLMHGTIILDMDIELMGRVLKNKKPGYVSSIKAETGITIPIPDLKDAVIRSFSDQFGLELILSSLIPEEKLKISELIKDKYSSKEWNFKR